MVFHKLKHFFKLNVPPARLFCVILCFLAGLLGHIWTWSLISHTVKILLQILVFSKYAISGYVLQGDVQRFDHNSLIIVSAIRVKFVILLLQQVEKEISWKPTDESCVPQKMQLH